MSGSFLIECFEREVTTQAAHGVTTENHAFLRLVVEGVSGILAVEVEAGDWSRALANPGVAVFANLTTIAKPSKGSAA
jgi:hypothetical protein